MPGAMTMIRLSRKEKVELDDEIQFWTNFFTVFSSVGVALKSVQPFVQFLKDANDDETSGEDNWLL